MKILNTGFPTSNLNHRYNQKPINFSGLNDPNTECAFFFDLGGTLTYGLLTDTRKIQEISEIAKQRNGHLIYATGEAFKEIKGFKKFLSQLGDRPPFPDPEYVISNDGKFLYRYKTGRKLTSYESMLKKKGITTTSKADGITFLQKFLKIPFNEIVMAGNDSNDIPMLMLAKDKGAHFICPNDAFKGLKEMVLSFGKNFPNIFSATKDGVEGVLEGLCKIIKGLK